MSSSAETFDVVVVGAGPAGSTAAWRLARGGARVALLERAASPGGKNLFGGMVYSLELQKHFPHFVSEAPMERPVTRHSTTMLAGDRAMTLDFSSEAFAEPPYNGFTTYRPRFDAWLAQQAVQAGALLAPSTVVDDLIVENGRVRGVVARREAGEIRAPVVICADGILSLLGKKAGLVPEPDAEHYSLGVREVLSLPAGVIEDRFQVETGGGCAALFAGKWNGGVQGGGFIYTNRDTLSVGFVAQMASLKNSRIHITEALDDFKRQPAVRRLIAGTESLEYGAHVVPEGGWNMRHKLVRDGLMLVGDAGGMVLAAGVIYEGVHYAMHSGILAAETALEALEKGDFTTRQLGKYQKRLNRSYVMRNLKAFRHVPCLLTNPRFYRAYPEAATAIMEGLFRADETGHRKLYGLLRQHLLKRVGGWHALKDAFSVIRAFF